MQLFVAAMILGNFFVNIIEKEIDPTSTLYSDTFYALECFFNISFFTRAHTVPTSQWALSTQCH